MDLERRGKSSAACPTLKETAPSSTQQASLREQAGWFGPSIVPACSEGSNAGVIIIGRRDSQVERPFQLNVSRCSGCCLAGRVVSARRKRFTTTPLSERDTAKFLRLVKQLVEDRPHVDPFVVRGEWWGCQ